MCVFYFPHLQKLLGIGNMPLLCENPKDSFPIFPQETNSLGGETKSCMAKKPFYLLLFPYPYFCFSVPLSKKHSRVSSYDKRQIKQITQTISFKITHHFCSILIIFDFGLLFYKFMRFLPTFTSHFELIF